MRRTGKTTRKIDEAIQELFKHGRIIVPNPQEADSNLFNNMVSVKYSDVPVFIDEDHQKGNMAQEYFKDKLLSRLHAEHNGYFDVKHNYLIISHAL